MNNFKLNLFIPTLSATAYFNEFNNKNLIDINKFTQSQDDSGLSSYLNTLLYQTEHTYTSFDKLFILLVFRIKSMGNIITLSIDEDVKRTVEIDIGLMLSKLNEYTPNILPAFRYNDLLINFKLPTNLYFSNYYDLLQDITNTVTFQSGSIVLKDDQKNLSIKKLKPNIVDSIKKHINKHSQSFKLTNMSNFDNIFVNLYDNSIMNVLKFIFVYNIASLYTKMFHISEKIHMDYMNFLSLTPSESDLLLTIYKNVNNIK